VFGPFDAVHMTAGHNAPPRIGSDSHLAFKNALAHVVGLIAGSTALQYVLFALQPSQSLHLPRRDLVYLGKRDGFLVIARPCAIHAQTNSPIWLAAR